MTVAEAEAALGVPLRGRAGAESPGCWITHRADGRDPGIGYMVVHGRIHRIDVQPQNGEGPTVTSPEGVGIGTAEATARSAYGARLRVEPHPYTGADGGRYLILNTPDGRSGLIFETYAGVVTDFRAGLRPELGYVEGCS